MEDLTMSEMDQRKIFSKNLNNMLHASGKSQKEVANAIGVLPTTFNTWCKGIALPRMGKVQLLADYFHVSKSALIDESSSASSRLSRTLSPDEAGLLDNYQLLNAAGKDKAREYVSDLTGNDKYTEKGIVSEGSASA